MAIPEKLKQEINTMRSRSPLQESDRTPISKKELWEIIDTIETELRSNRHDTELSHALAVAYFARGLFLSSEENLYSAINRNPQNAIIPYNLDILYYGAQQKMKAEKPSNLIWLFLPV
jgi:cytochrome c-type biogenesis protein CcmH/NrfG